MQLVYILVEHAMQSVYTQCNPLSKCRITDYILILDVYGFCIHASRWLIWRFSAKMSIALPFLKFFIFFNIHSPNFGLQSCSKYYIMSVDYLVVCLHAFLL